MGFHADIECTLAKSLFADPGIQIVYVTAFDCIIPLVRTHASQHVVRLTCDSPVEFRFGNSLGTHVTGFSGKDRRGLSHITELCLFSTRYIASEHSIA